MKRVRRVRARGGAGLRVGARARVAEEPETSILTVSDATLYRQLVGSLIYLTVTGRTLLMLFIWLVSSCLLLAPLIMLQLFVF